MSKKLNKLVDINGLREFKNKLVGTDSAYVQTGAVDQTVAGTKTFSKPIAGSVTGSSGSCTGNAATATNATYTNWLRTSSHSDHLFHTEWDKAGYFWTYVTAGNGDYRAVRVARSNSAATAESCTGNAATATKLAAKRTIALSGAATGTATAFDGSGNITIPVTSLDASKLTGTASVNTTGNAATATKATNGVDSQGGNWIRFRNGIQICWAKISCGTSGASTWTYGASFSSAPVVTVCDTGYNTNMVYLTRAGNIGKTSCLIVMVDESGGSHTGGEAQCIAIGRWK